MKTLLLLMLLQEAGDKAPDFTLKNQAGQDVALSSFQGKKNVLLAFYPKDFTGG